MIFTEHTRTFVGALAVAASLVGASAAAQIERPPSTPNAEATLQLTLDDAVRRAVDHNPDLAIVRLETEVDAAHVGETESVYLPVFSTILGRSSNVAPPATWT